MVLILNIKMDLKFPQFVSELKEKTCWFYFMPLITFIQILDMDKVYIKIYFKALMHFLNFRWNSYWICMYKLIWNKILKAIEGTSSCQ